MFASEFLLHKTGSESYSIRRVSIYNVHAALKMGHYGKVTVTDNQLFESIVTHLWNAYVSGYMARKG